jgi:hypothetical protein
MMFCFNAWGKKQGSFEDGEADSFEPVIKVPHLFLFNISRLRRCAVFVSFKQRLWVKCGPGGNGFLK